MQSRSRSEAHRRLGGRSAPYANCVRAGIADLRGFPRSEVTRQISPWDSRAAPPQDRLHKTASTKLRLSFGGRPVLVAPRRAPLRSSPTAAHRVDVEPSWLPMEHRSETMDSPCSVHSNLRPPQNDVARATNRLAPSRTCPSPARSDRCRRLVSPGSFEEQIRPRPSRQATLVECGRRRIDERSRIRSVFKALPSGALCSSSRRASSAVR